MSGIQDYQNSLVAIGEDYDQKLKELEVKQNQNNGIEVPEDESMLPQSANDGTGPTISGPTREEREKFIQDYVESISDRNDIEIHMTIGSSQTLHEQRNLKLNISYEGTKWIKHGIHRCFRCNISKGLLLPKLDRLVEVECNTYASMESSEVAIDSSVGSTDSSDLSTGSSEVPKDNLKILIMF